MKNIISACSVLLLILLSGACSKEEVALYEQSSTVYFNEYFRNYTFLENADKIEVGFDTVKIPLQISGSAMAYDREVEMEVVTEDTLHTAAPEMFSFGKGCIPANKFKGYMPVRVNYSKALNDSVYNILLRLVPSKDFPGVDLEQTIFTLSVTNKITAPSNWHKLKPYFGPYSNSWYRFILETTGLTSIPYWSRNGSFDYWNPDPERWTMSLYELKTYVAIVKEELQEYNRKHPNDHLTHQDGDEKGKEVVMP